MKRETKKTINFGGKLSFILSFPFPELCCYIYFQCSYLYNYYNKSRTLCIKCTTTIVNLKPCALNAEFQHFILRFTIPLKRGDRGSKEAQRQGEDRVALWITLLLDRFQQVVA